MTITLTAEEQQNLWAEASLKDWPVWEPPFFESLALFPQTVGSGHVQIIEVFPDVHLELWRFSCRDDVQIKLPTSKHPVQFTVLLSGKLETSSGQSLSAKHTLISGGGLQRSMTIEFQKNEPFIGVNIELSPERLAAFFPGADSQIAPEWPF
jgi:hypothetical protein